jgi:hypothetical protein
VRTIREHGLDFILRFSFGIIRGEVLSSARFGIWSFHHGDEEKYRGAPPCFWEIYDGDAVTGSMLQRLTDRLDAGVVLHKGFFRTIDHSYVRNRDQAFFGSGEWPARVCKDVYSDVAAYLDVSPSASTAPLRRNPTARQVIRFLLTLGRNFVRNQIDLCCDTTSGTWESLTGRSTVYSMRTLMVFDGCPPRSAVVTSLTLSASHGGAPL